MYIFIKNICSTKIFKLRHVLLQIKESMVATERHHKDTLQQMEHKFFEEKVMV